MSTIVSDLDAPLAYHQERLWFIDEFERDRVYPGPPTYHNIPVLLRIDGRIEAPILERALNALLVRHDALRTSIREGRQRIRRRGSLVLPVVECSASEEAAIRAAIADSRRPFFLDLDILCRAALYRFTSARSLLALTVHHAVADRRSTQILAEEFAELVRAATAGEAPRLPGVAGFPAYAMWQRAIANADFEPALRFWRWQFQSEPPPLELPYIGARHRIHVYQPASRDLVLAGECVSMLADLAGRHGVDLSDVVLAGLLITLHAYSRQHEVVIGTSHANRDTGLDRMVGPLANLLALRCDVHPGNRFTDVIRAVARTTRQARANRSVPFDRLVHELNPPKDMSRTALFDVLYEFLDDEPHAWKVRGATITRIRTSGGFGKYDLHVALQRAGAELVGALVYNAELFDGDFIDEWLGFLEEVFARVARDPEVSVRRLVELPAAAVERQRALFRARPGRQPAETTLDEAFEVRVRQSPDRIAIAADDGQVSFERLARDARRICRALLAVGVRPGTSVAVFLERSREAVAAMLGILRAGAAYVPVDPEYPPMRVAMLIEDSEVPVAITRAALAGRLREHAAGRSLRIIELEGCASFSTAPLGSRSAPRDAAYSIYTSGSTGRPKGCLVAHRNVVHLLLGQTTAFDFAEGDVWTWAHSICFDFSVWEIFGALLHGARGVPLSHDAVRDPGLVQQVLAREQVTVLNQTPTAGYRLIERLLESKASVPSLRWLIFGGDALSPRRLHDWAVRNPHIGVVNMFGITETTVHVTHKALTIEEMHDDTKSVGRALPDAAVYVVDERGEMVPCGVAGEVAVTGSGVSLGYWRRPDLTAERFVPNCFDESGGGRLYRSGDVGRMLRNGELEFHGRRDDQVKIRGHRIELGEIEAALAEHPAVSEAAAVARTDGSGERMLVAFVVPAHDEVSIRELRRHLQARLASSMLPHAIQSLPVLPRTTSGKVDRNALARITLAATTPMRGRMSPRDECEQTLARVWEEVLGRRPIAVTDNFFEIGGDSILSIQICARAARAGLVLAPKQIFEHSTIEELARAIGDVPKTIAVAPRVACAPLLPAQAWFFAQQYAEPNHFNQSAWFALASDVTLEKLETALRQLRAHHDALRVTFVYRDGAILQEVADSPNAVAIESVSADAGSAAVAAAVARAQRGLDIHDGPLFRCVYVEAGATSSAHLLLVFHHLVVDAVSWRVIVDDLDLLLGTNRENDQLLPPAGSILQSALHATGGQFESGAADDNVFATYEEVTTLLDEATTAAIGGVLGSEKCGWEDALVAAVSRVLTEWTGGDRAELYVESHGRDLCTADPSMLRTIGWFTKLHRVEIARRDATMQECVRSCRTQLAAARSGPDFFTQGFAPGVCVNYLGQIADVAERSPRITLVQADNGESIGPRNRRVHLLDVNARVQQGRLHVNWGYSTALHRRDIIEERAARCLQLLQQLASVTVEPPALHALAPGQLGIFVHALLGPQGSPEYVIRSLLEITGAFDVEAFRASWVLLLERHEALRASFIVDGAEGPRQRFHAHVPLRWREHDWRDVEHSSVTEQLEALERHLARAGLDLRTPPLVSIDIVRADHRAYYAFVQIHHLLVDGWSLSVLRDELLRAYDALSAGEDVQMDSPGRFRDYLRYLERLPTEAAKNFWSDRLQGASGTTIARAVGPEMESSPIESHSVDVIDRPLSTDGGYGKWAAAHNLTMNTVMQGLWSLVLATLTDRNDVVTGAVVAGRPTDLPEAERTVGSFINILPLRAIVHPEEALARWFRTLQRQFNTAQEFAHWPLPDLYGWASLPKDKPLFDTVLVCQNYPSSAPRRLRDVTIREVRYSLKEAIPLVVEYSLADRLVCRFRYRVDLIGAARLEEAAELLRYAVDALESEHDLVVGRLLARLKDVLADQRRSSQDEFAVARLNLLHARNRSSRTGMS